MVKITTCNHIHDSPVKGVVVEGSASVVNCLNQSKGSSVVVVGSSVVGPMAQSGQKSWSCAS